MKKTVFFLAIPLIAICNYVTGVIANYMAIPFFLDTWATSLGAMAFGLPVGIAGGVLYNFFMAGTVWGWDAWVWTFSSIWVAFISYVLYRTGWIDIQKPFRLITAGFLIGFSNAFVATAISLIAFGGLPTYAGTEPTYRFFFAITQSRVLATFGENLLSELADKTVAIFIAAVVLAHIPKRYRLGWKR